MKALSNKFDSVYILDMDTGIVVPFFLSEKNKLEYQDAFDRGAMWEDLRWEYGSKYVHKEYKEDFRRNARLSKSVLKWRPMAFISTNIKMTGMA